MYTTHSENNPKRLGYYISLFGAALILLWIGIFKFTPTEADSIKPLVENHFLTFWVYKVFNVQTVSNLIGLVEIILAMVLLLSVKLTGLKKLAGMGMVVTFLITLSYLFTTPNIWRTVDGILVPDFFILKDLMFLGFGFTLLQHNENK
ncbi:DUF417 family protein [Chryseobacterium sp. CT-SW4]|uniref:DUF417 family protein n=1 Tax=Chryseobacterium sp. SW-1 TaxID=3157343 RepID=UPI003B01628A